MLARLVLRNRLTVVGLGLIVMGVVMLIALSGIQSYGRQERAFQTVVVSKGDTLWTIALRVKPGIDPRKTVFHIKKASGLESVDIAPGQVLMVPIDL